MMRAHVRRRRRDEEEESAFVSMTDLTISFLIIIMILLAFFASRFVDEEMVPRPMLDAARSRADGLRAERDALSERLDAAADRVAMLEAEADRRAADLVAALRLAMELRAEADRLQAENAALRREIEALRRPDPLEAYLGRVAEARGIALRQLRDAIQAEFPDLNVVVSSESDALRFQGEGLFSSGSKTLGTDKRRIVERIAELLDGVLPCYSLGPRSAHANDCNPGYAVIEAVQIEGHTDEVGSDTYNMDLGSGRAVSTYNAMTAQVPGLLEHRNLDGEPVLSVAGYGENRPVVANTSDEGRSTNRRIDLRIIMFSPSSSTEIGMIRERLAESGGGLEADR
jgi:outer membrane protein OmpA-like peptidoglycan-associated protein